MKIKTGIKCVDTLPPTDYMCSSEASKAQFIHFSAKIRLQLRAKKLIKAQGMKATE